MRGAPASEHPQIWPIKDLYREPLFRTLAPFFQSTSARGLLIIPLYYGSQVMGCLTIFREAIDTEVKWAGWHNPDSRQLMARQSFEVWQEAQKDQAPVWTDSEISYAKALVNGFQPLFSSTDSTNKCRRSIQLWSGR